MQSMEDVRRSLVDAVFEGRLESVRELINTYGLSYSPDWQQGYVLLRIAVEKRHSEVAKLLLTRGAKVNRENTDRYDTPLHSAARYGDLELVEMLLNYGADVNARDEDGGTALHDSSWYGHKEVVKVLLEHGAEVDSKTDNGSTPLHEAAERGKLEVVETLLEFGADTEARDEDGGTALHEASGWGHKEVVKVLLEHSAEVDSKMNNGYTPLHRAAEGGELEVVETLLESGADIEARDEDGGTALHAASYYGHKEVVKVLLEHGAEVDSKTYHGSTPLHRAAERGKLEVVEALLKYGGDINITNIDNQTPLDIAEDRPAAEPLRWHIIQLNTANLYLNVRNLESMKHFMDEFSTFRVQCENEVSGMKNEKLKKSNVSYYDVLTKTNLLSAYMRNENILEALKSEDYRTTFPIYADMLKRNLRKAMERKYLLEQVHPISHPFDKLPCECVEEIFTYLSNKDITAFIVAYKPLWRRGELRL